MSIVGKEVAVFIPGAPQAKERPRFRVVGGRVMTYTPKRTADYEQFISECVRAIHPSHVAYEGPISVTMRVVIPFPKSKKALYHTTDCPKLIGDSIPVPSSCLMGTIYTPCSKCKPIGLAWYVPVYPVTRPDTDNYAKCLLDGIQKSGIIEDDKQVIWMDVSKEYGTPAQIGVDVIIRYGKK